MEVDVDGQLELTVAVLLETERCRRALAHRIGERGVQVEDHLAHQLVHVLTLVARAHEQIPLVRVVAATAAAAAAAAAADWAEHLVAQQARLVANLDDHANSLVFGLYVFVLSFCFVSSLLINGGCLLRPFLSNDAAAFAGCIATACGLGWLVCVGRARVSFLLHYRRRHDNHNSRQIGCSKRPVCFECESGVMRHTHTLTCAALCCYCCCCACARRMQLTRTRTLGRLLFLLLLLLLLRLLRLSTKTRRRRR